MKVSVRLIGGAFARVDALAADIRRRALETLEARYAARSERRQQQKPVSAISNTPSER
jgi:hypothetical protein